MAVHIFVVDETNYQMCIRTGLAAIPDSEKPNIQDALISRMALIRKNDFVLFYIIGKKELRGVYKVLECPFYDMTQVWAKTDDGQIYPLRIRIDNSDYTFSNPICLSDIYDLRDNGKIWTFALKRPTGTRNAMFSISDHEFEELFNLYLKLNPINFEPKQIKEPYRYFEPNLMDYLTINSDTLEPKYESTLMSLISQGLSKENFKDIFGNYHDYLSYIPTSFEKEIDMLLIFNNPRNLQQTIAYNIIEIKRDIFDEKALEQLLQYEDWFLRKKVNGDSTMLRTTGIAKKINKDVISYLKTRKQIENKKVILLEYENTFSKLIFNQVEY